jgi:hypothetical protein
MEGLERIEQRKGRTESREEEESTEKRREYRRGKSRFTQNTQTKTKAEWGYMIAHT